MEVPISQSAQSQDKVVAMCAKARVGGGRRVKEPDDHRFTDNGGFDALDGHVWEHLWMNHGVALVNGQAGWHQ